ncbi:uncharacterized protein LOC132256500 [Phlebotomus argentipes]|uniref:uncharacterized protein LOC132256500 n=1 Tax=Phlebotomus argentipes TaxID=94469 RepID=UPI0028931C10|nr:uncharacterized protein LOC132256500 [Phlebotomus argentipes]
MEKPQGFVYSKLLKEQLQLVKTKEILQKMLNSVNENLNAALVQQLQLASDQESSSSAQHPPDVAAEEISAEQEVKDIIQETLNLEVRSRMKMDEESEEESD